MHLVKNNRIDVGYAEKLDRKRASHVAGSDIRLSPRSELQMSEVAILNAVHQIWLLIA